MVTPKFGFKQVRITSVEIDALVALQITKHCRESLPATVTGQILGVDVGPVLHITYSFPFTATSTSDESGPDSGEVDYDDLDGTQYQVNMLKRLRQMNYDVHNVGWYRTADLNLFEQTFIDNQVQYQRAFANSVVIAYDPLKSQQGALGLCAYRLTPTFLTMYREGRFTAEAIAASGLTFSKVLESIPVRVRTGKLAGALMARLEEAAANPSSVARSVSAPNPTFNPNRIPPTAPLSPNLDVLELSFENYLEQRLDSMLQEAENQYQDQQRWGWWSRNYNRELTRANQTVQKRRQENASRAANNLAPLWSEEDMQPNSTALQRIAANEPSRLESLLIAKRLDAYSRQVNQFAGPGLAKMYVTKAIQDLALAGGADV
ncbi:hypothetical protein HDU93_001085 [Gonapodya sp. JEL0774]|nr:hypothetical protein HDU93_001085 [Gonapodya sp. JEL0774]